MRIRFRRRSCSSPPPPAVRGDKGSDLSMGGHGINDPYNVSPRTISSKPEEDLKGKEEMWVQEGGIHDHAPVRTQHGAVSMEGAYNSAGSLMSPKDATLRWGKVDKAIPLKKRSLSIYQSEEEKEEEQIEGQFCNKENHYEFDGEEQYEGDYEKEQSEQENEDSIIDVDCEEEQCNEVIYITDDDCEEEQCNEEEGKEKYMIEEEVVGTEINDPITLLAAPASWLSEPANNKVTNAITSITVEGKNLMYWFDGEKIVTKPRSKGKRKPRTTYPSLNSDNTTAFVIKNASASGYEGEEDDDLYSKVKKRRERLSNEPSRCTRSNGKRWRCNHLVEVGYSLCKHHLGLLTNLQSQVGDKPKKERKAKMGKKPKVRSMKSMYAKTVPLAFAKR